MERIMADMGIGAALLISSMVTAGASMGAAAMQPDLDMPDMPDFEAEAAKRAEEEKRRVQQSQQRLSERQATRGPIQLQGAALGF